MFVACMVVFKGKLSSFYLSSKLREAATQEAETLLQMPPVLEEREEINMVLSDDRTLQGLETANIVFTDISYGLSERVNCKCFYDSYHTKETKVQWLGRRMKNKPSTICCCCYCLTLTDEVKYLWGLFCPNFMLATLSQSGYYMFQLTVSIKFRG